MLKHLLTFVIVIVAVSAVGYLAFPGSMLSVVGIASSPHNNFLLQTLGVALIAMIPGLWAARSAPDSPVSRMVLIGIVIYLIFSSIVDAIAYAQSLVGTAAIPSIAFRVLLAAGILFLMPKGRAPT